jgi:hypothetical protein
MKRRIDPELLDTLPPNDPRALRSRQDLRRVNWWMGNHASMANALIQNTDVALPRHVLEIGAGDGHFLLTVARKLSSSWPGSKATLLDRLLNVSVETRSEFAALQWELATTTADVFDWAPLPGGHSVIIANLFLHHFEDARLADLLQKIANGTRLFIALEPRRMSWPILGGLLLAFIGCNGVTRHDGTVSIRAGFSCRELSALWPDHHRWQLTEKRSGLFSHLFIARRID